MRRKVLYKIPGIPESVGIITWGNHSLIPNQGCSFHPPTIFDFKPQKKTEKKTILDVPALVPSLPASSLDGSLNLHLFRGEIVDDLANLRVNICEFVVAQ